MHPLRCYHTLGHYPSHAGLSAGRLVAAGFRNFPQFDSVAVARRPLADVFRAALTTLFSLSPLSPSAGRPEDPYSQPFLPLCGEVQGPVFSGPPSPFAGRPEGPLSRVIVTPAVYPRLVEFLHFDIQSTGQKSHCVNTTFWPSQCYVLIRQSDSPCPYQFQVGC